MKCVFFICVCFCTLIDTLSTNELQPDKAEEISYNLLESNSYLKYIFDKYGNKNGTISYEGFEHLLENLGLGQLKFEREHSLEEHKNEDGRFEELHHKLQLHKHNHSERKRSIRNVNERHANEEKYSPESRSKCLTPEEILHLYNLEPSQSHEIYIKPNLFLSMCPVIVYELDQKSCSYHVISNKRGRITLDNIYHVWLSASISVLVISFVGLLGVSIVPLLQKAFFNELLSFLVALAVGTLCGDALLHLLPHALEKGEDEGPHIVVLKAGTVFLTVIFFFVIENLLSRSKNKVSSKDVDSTENDSMPKADVQLQEKSKLHAHSHTVPRPTNSISSVAYMVIMGDGLHNLTDGLAIGAAFSGDVVSGFSTAIAVFTHELPHELGDFAVLLQTGMTVNQALFYNIISSILSFIGMIAGLLLGNFTSASQWIYAITAGAFLYIGLVNLVPEIKRPIGNGKIDLLIQFCGILCGGLIMLVIALFEHDLENILLK